MSKRLGMVLALAGAGLAGAAGASAPAAAQEAYAIEVGADQTVLDLVVRGTTTRVPDIVTISAGVTSEAGNASEALRLNSASMQRVVEALRDLGVARRDIRTQQINLSPIYEDRRYGGVAKISGYRASNMVSVRFREIEQSGRVLDILVGEGANQINGPSFELDDPAEALDEARRDALEQGRERAELYAKALGKRVVRLAHFSEGRSRMPSPIVVTGARMEMDAAAAPPIEAGEQEIGVSLEMRFILE